MANRDDNDDSALPTFLGGPDKPSRLGSGRDTNCNPGDPQDQVKAYRDHAQAVIDEAKRNTVANNSGRVQTPRFVK